MSTFTSKQVALFLHGELKQASHGSIKGKSVFFVQKVHKINLLIYFSPNKIRWRLDALFLWPLGNQNGKLIPFPIYFKRQKVGCHLQVLCLVNWHSNWERHWIVSLAPVYLPGTRDSSSWTLDSKSTVRVCNSVTSSLNCDTSFWIIVTVVLSAVRTNK